MTTSKFPLTSITVERPDIDAMEIEAREAIMTCQHVDIATCLDCKAPRNLLLLCGYTRSLEHRVIRLEGKHEENRAEIEKLNHALTAIDERIRTQVAEAVALALKVVKP
jgi:hypothetical protein